MSIVSPEEETANHFFNDLATLMRSDEFRLFYKTHMNSSSDLKSSIVFIELYQTIETMVSNMDREISDAEMQALLRECIRRKEYRRPLTSIIQTYLTKGIHRKELVLSLRVRVVGVHLF
jgi:hypothetical protein